VRKGPEEALALAHGASRVLVAKGKKLISYDMKKDAPADEELVKGIIGPSGNLRAPTIVVGKTMLVGFHPEAYEEVFG
jgi:arsenate reductase-like glutaredoxin family protein